jgi:hypothetical protein
MSKNFVTITIHHHNKPLEQKKVSESPSRKKIVYLQPIYSDHLHNLLAASTSKVDKEPL